MRELNDPRVRQDSVECLDDNGLPSGKFATGTAADFICPSFNNRSADQSDWDIPFLFCVFVGLSDYIRTRI